MNMRATRKSFGFLLCMLVTVFACMIGATAKAASPEGLFATSAVSGGVKITRYDGAEDVIDIPATIGGKRVVEIGSNIIPAEYRTEVERVIIPQYVKTIGSQAFKDCTALYGVTVNGTALVTIGSSAFEGCERLSYVESPSAVQKNGSLYLPASTRTISARAFYGTSFGTISLPGTVETIGDYAFGNNKNLYSVTVGNGTKSIGNNICVSCPNLYSMTIPASVTSIGATLAPAKDVVLRVYSGSYAEKYISDKDLSNTKEVLGSTAPTTLRFKPASQTSRKYVFYVGEVIDMSSTLEAKGGTNALTWSSSKSSVLTVDRYGKITAKGAGTATLVVKASKNPSKSAYTKKANVNITVKKAPTKMYVFQQKSENSKTIYNTKKSSHKLATYKTMWLAARVAPAEGAPITFTSSNTKVATVSNVKTFSNGKHTYTVCKVTGVGEGSTSIVASSYNGKKASYTLNVEFERKAASKNWGMKTSYKVTAGSVMSTSLRTALPSVPKEAKFTSLNTSIAKINNDGTVTGVKPGVVTVRAYTATEKAETSIIVLPKKMQITSVTASKSHKITLKWKKQSGTSIYRIAYRKKGSSKWTVKTASSGKSSFTTGKLKKGTKYEIKVQGGVKTGTKSGKAVYQWGSYSTTKTVAAK